MPISKSAKKALRQSIKRKKRNLWYKKRMKSLIKKFHSLIDANKKEEAKKLLPSIYKIIDKSAKVGVLKKRAAARKKSKIAKKAI
ncbi:30S ribosomal protein S20 [bacterium]|nr:30S ribosomal protein S20 [bacterium]